jgi:DNA polymerase (family X)
MGLDTNEVSGLLKEFGLRMSLKGGNPYRAKAFLTAAQNLKTLSQPLDKVIARGGLTAVPGIGEAISDIVEKLHRTGTHPRLEEMRKEMPSGLLEILELPQVRAQDLAKIQKAGIQGLAELEEALRNGKLNGVAGFTEAFRKKLLDGIEIRRNTAGRMHMHRARRLAEEAKKQLERAKGVKQVAIAGEVRRQCELAGALSLVAVGKGQKPLQGEVAVHFCRKEEFGAALLFATGSDSHIAQLQARAQDMGLRLTETGVIKGKVRVAGATEEEIYEALGLQFIPPELREGRGEIAKAAQRKIPALVELEDVRGILHAHTLRSDGAATLPEMAQASRKRGFEYLGLTDHSQSAHYAGGLKIPEVREQQREADRLNKKFGKSFRIFRGIESDILSSGALDYPDEILETFDFIIASVHGQFRLSGEEQTRRILRAIANPYTTILGHVTGRQLLRRRGYDVDIPAVLRACAEHEVAIEVNGHPWRLDLDWRWLDMALALGCWISLNPDAHSTAEIDHVAWAVAMARKGGVPKERVLNCLGAEEFGRFLLRRKRKVH